MTKDYFKAMLDIYNFLQHNDTYAFKGLHPSKKLLLTKNLIKYLAENHDKREMFYLTGGKVNYKTDKNLNVLDMWR